MIVSPFGNQRVDVHEQGENLIGPLKSRLFAVEHNHQGALHRPMAQTSFGTRDQLLVKLLVDQRTKRIGRFLHVVERRFPSGGIRFLLFEEATPTFVEQNSSTPQT